MASFEKRGSSVRAIVRVPGGGKKTRTFDTQGEAERWGADMERKKELGEADEFSGNGPTCGELFEEYEEEVASKTDSAKWNGLRLHKFQLDPLASKKIAAVTTHDINQWIKRAQLRPSERDGEPISGSTVNRELNLMSGAFTYAIKVRKWLKVNPCHGAVRPPEGDPKKMPLLSQLQRDAVAQAGGLDVDPQLHTKTARSVATFFASLETGMRSGENLRVKPEHYDRARRMIRVAAEEKGGRKSAKSGRVRGIKGRWVPLTDKAVELWDALLATMPPGQPYIVGLTDGQRDALWRKVRDRVGMIDDYTFHHSKHEACTRLARFLDPLELSHAVGIKDIRLLRDTYYEPDAARAAARLPAHLAASL